MFLNTLCLTPFQNLKYMYISHSFWPINIQKAKLVNSHFVFIKIITICHITIGTYVRKCLSSNESLLIAKALPLINTRIKIINSQTLNSCSCNSMCFYICCCRNVLLIKETIKGYMPIAKQ